MATAIVHYHLGFMEFEVVQMSDSDLSEVAEIEELAQLSKWGYETYKKELGENPDAIMLVAKNLIPVKPYFAVLGFLAAWVVADEMHINNIGTHPDFRRLGVGKALLEEALTEGHMRGANFCLLEVRISNRAAISLYQSFGFEAVGRRGNYYTFPMEDALVMQKKL
ncbi:MAG TPA: ribosomal protein S18-alanine N-acetyltransferase [Blastocatellia bacterium]|nr:ribosomal protein S18-alanine N-acetyltransferase [Blastocatellia bacterium]